MKPAYYELGFNITCIDTQHMRDDFVAAYLTHSMVKKICRNVDATH